MIIPDDLIDYDTPEHLLSIRESEAIVAACVADLPPSLRCMIQATELDDEPCTHAEYAAKLGVSRAYVGQLREQAIKKLRKKYNAKTRSICAH